MTCVGAFFLGVLVVILIILIVALVNAGVRKWYVEKPTDCSRYSGTDGTMCSLAVAQCDSSLSGKDAKVCKAAIGPCLPVVKAAIGGTSGKSVTPAQATQKFTQAAQNFPACVDAITKMSPEGVIKLATISTKGGADHVCANPAEYAVLNDKNAMRAALRSSYYAPRLTQWGIRVGQALPLCQKPVAPASMAQATHVGSFAPYDPQRRNAPYDGPLIRRAY